MDQKPLPCRPLSRDPSEIQPTKIPKGISKVNGRGSGGRIRTSNHYARSGVAGATDHFPTRHLQQCATATMSPASTVATLNPSEETKQPICTPNGNDNCSNQKP